MTNSSDPKKLVETPRTDKAQFFAGNIHNSAFSTGELVVVAKFARQLERELASLADELRLAREALKQAAEMLQASLPYWQTDELGNGPDCTPMLQAILNVNAALKDAASSGPKEVE